MTYDHWKTTNPADEHLGPEPEEAMTRSADVTPNDHHYRNIHARWKALAKFAGGITPTEIPLEPTPDSLRGLSDDLQLLAANVDRLIADYGAYLDANVPGYTDQRLFQDQLRGALDGNALYEIESEADQLEMDMREAVR